jgi:hypothetical protein
MKTKKFFSMLTSGVALLLAGGMFAQAATLDIYTDSGKLTKFGTLNWNDAAVTVEAVPDSFLQNWTGGDAAEFAAFKTVFGLPDDAKLSKNEDGNDSFSVLGREFSVKFGGGKLDGAVAYFRITSDPVSFPVSFTWSGEPKLGAGVSHVVSSVPLPAAAYLFGSALFGMAGIGYRRNKKQA